MNILKNRKKLDLFLISFYLLYIELLLIRFLTTHIHLLSFFANFVLLAAFLGTGAGCLNQNKKKSLHWILIFLPFILCGISLYLYHKHAFLSFNPDQIKTNIYFGGILQPSRTFPIKVDFVIIFLFILVTVFFNSIGKILGENLRNFPPLTGYGINLFGSLLGIIIFSIFSYFSLNAYIWWLFIIPFFLFHSCFKKIEKIIATILIIICVYMIIYSNSYGNSDTYWSPYYRITLKKNIIFVNNIGHQAMEDSSSAENLIYRIPYFIRTQSGQRAPEKVLIIGAGSGNDVANALDQGVEEIDAVEIDPVIYQIGRDLHPERPYNSKKVKVHIADGRNFLQQNNEKYDMIIFALVDSLTLFSAQTSVRLESFIFTQESFEKVKKRLKPDGQFVIYNIFRYNWLPIRIKKMLTEVFGAPPLIMYLPPTPEVDIESPPTMQATIFIAGNNKKINEFVASNPVMPENITGTKNKTILYKTNIKGEKFFKTKLPKDNWPFLYLKKPGIPGFNIKIMIFILVFSIILVLFSLRKKKNGKIKLAFFFLGGAFMLLETSAVIKLSLIFGSTWSVNAVVFASIILVAFFANLLAFKLSPKYILYIGMLTVISVLVNIKIGTAWMIGLNPVIVFLGIIGVYFLPIFLGSLLFSLTFSLIKNPDINLGINLLGIMLGGLLENFSLIGGYNILYWLIAVFYLIGGLLAYKNK